ncbi:unnamed protein product [Gongylonema pulchrum]|uniref:C2H2-type domain-containing protein n=1 Tax=Gongylonema pulchrum TaxID=637853 RepID=A0A183D520_9BILA|nr:unnamed protein product [Gongylonema pulchrum]
MIRHKRVHTNERPFRCKYCSRTSKWKADLIRHVASQFALSSPAMLLKHMVSEWFQSTAEANSIVRRMLRWIWPPIELN